jgi:hypothetical protein
VAVDGLFITAQREVEHLPKKKIKKIYHIYATKMLHNTLDYCKIAKSKYFHTLKFFLANDLQLGAIDEKINVTILMGLCSRAWFSAFSIQ